jgi:hypothetical protein
MNGHKAEAGIMKKTAMTCALVWCLCGIGHAELAIESYLTGELSGTLKRGDYIVTGTLYVLKGQTLQIPPGTRLYFEQYSGITVIGSLFCEGSLDSPIVMTSKKEMPGERGEIKTEAEPFDWNGIETTVDASLCAVTNASIRNCVFGIKIKSEKTKITISNVTFYNNGYTCISRAGKNVEVLPGYPFSITWNFDENSPVERLVIGSGESKKTVSAQTKNPAKKPQQDAAPQGGERAPAPIKWTLGIGGGAISLTGAGLLIGGILSYSSNIDRYSIQIEPSLAEYYRKRYQKASATAWTGGILLAAGLGLVTYTVFF